MDNAQTTGYQRLSIPNRRAFLVIALCLMVLGGVAGSAALISCASHSAGEYPNVEVQFVNSGPGWIVGPRLLHTTDRGLTWNVIRDSGVGTVRANFIFDSQQQVQFINSQIGWVLGSNTIYRSTDGGRTWPDIFPIPIGRDEFPIQVFFFVSPEQGWALGNYLYHTSDGGQHWRRLSKVPEGDGRPQREMQISSDAANYIPALWFNDSRRGLMARKDGLIYLTADGGNTWEMVWQSNAMINDVFFINDQNGWVVGASGFAARTNDGGRT